MGKNYKLNNFIFKNIICGVKKKEVILLRIYMLFGEEMDILSTL